MPVSQVGGFAVPTSLAVQIALGLLLIITVGAVLGRRRRYPATIVVLVVVLVFTLALTALGLPATAVTAIVAAAAVTSVRLGARSRES
ncbi:hypothetical protein [Dactylosporangium sp. CA-092794]|uniref:hypothetical protein n=1 Tax=Dactylosporangium sp. CA-092794 TaxID=3239929 RepID=UPI003D8D18EE